MEDLAVGSSPILPPASSSIRAQALPPKVEASTPPPPTEWKATTLRKYKVDGKTYLNQYRTIRRIARGTFCTVKLCVTNEESLRIYYSPKLTESTVGAADSLPSVTVSESNNGGSSSALAVSTIEGDPTGSPKHTEVAVSGSSRFITPGVCTAPRSSAEATSSTNELEGLAATLSPISAAEYARASSEGPMTTTTTTPLYSPPSPSRRDIQADSHPATPPFCRDSPKLATLPRKFNYLLSSPPAVEQYSTAHPPEIPQFEGFPPAQKGVSPSSSSEETPQKTSKDKFFALKSYRKSKLLRYRDFGKDSITGRSKLNNQLGQVILEMKLMQAIDNPRCLKCHEVLESYEPTGKLYLVFDFLECGAIMRYCKDRYKPLLKGVDTLSEGISKCIFKDVLEGVAYLHQELGVAHRDIKPENILMNGEGRVKICDFGLAEYMDANGRVRNTKVSVCCSHALQGTYYFMPPESVELPKAGEPYRGHDGRAADMWSAGVTLWVLLFGTLPIVGSSIQELFDNIHKARYEFPSYPPVSVLAKETLSRLLCKEYTQRISAREALDTLEWLKDVDYEEVKRYATLLKEEQLAEDEDECF